MLVTDLGDATTQAVIRQPIAIATTLLVEGEEISFTTYR